MKKTLSLLLCILLSVVCFAGCSSGSGPLAGGDFSSDYAMLGGDSSQAVTSSGPVYAMNPLTGERDLDPAAKDLRPVALMVNNVQTAQEVQTGLQYADIIYEMNVEGGITRLMAVFKDIAKAKKLGTIRSARYDYVDLAAGHDAVYIHAGLDTTYCQPYMKETNTDNINLLAGAYYGYAFREKNGKALEHTLYSTGENINKMLDDKGWRRSLKNHTGLWANFRDAAAPYTPAQGVCNAVTIPVSNIFKPGFTYDATTKMYKKTQDGDPHNDYVTGEQVAVKNVFICQTTVSYRPDNLHMDIDLSSGKGYYLSEGGYQEINWSKGSRTNALVFKDATGNTLMPNAGTSWVIFVRKSATIQFS